MTAFGNNPLAPALATFRNYNRHKLRRDFVAGLTVSVVELPQAIAYALIAGVPPEYGLYTSVIQGILGALLSSSEHLTSGPTNTQSLLIAAAVTRVAGGMGEDVGGAVYLQLVFTLTLLKGLIQLAFWGGRFANLVQFISRSVILGVSTGAGVLILSGQLAYFLGVPKADANRLWGVPSDLVRIWPNLSDTNPYAVGIGVGTIALILVARLISRFFPGALLAVVISATLVAVLGWEERMQVVGAIPVHLPQFTLPTLDLDAWSQLLPGALALAMLGSIESIAIAKTIAGRSGEQVSPNQEVFTQGLKNTLSSFFQCIPGSASFTRSALDYDAGAETRVAAILNGCFVAAMFFLLADYARFIPYATLAGILFVVAWGLLERSYFTRVYRANRSDAVVFAATFLSTILLPLQYAVFIGIFLNIAFVLRVSSRLHIAQMVQTEGGGFMERPIYDRAGEQKVIFVQLEGELYFAVADQLREQLTAIRRSSVRVAILRLKQIHSIDATILHVLEDFAKEMRQRNGHVILCGLRDETLKPIQAYGLEQIISKENLFMTGPGLFDGAKLALQRARVLVGTSIDASRFKADDEGDLTYEI
ncbi:MAG TPA: SulP family inorganic anion transporter [Tepidisphaeraceae bacterium]|jgi:SulP family sulfate permease|nr:SulP family inorganic anion transporter [Tepidisphaeraceae bacterium]